LKAKEKAIIIIIALLITQFALPWIARSVKAAPDETDTGWLNYPGNHCLDLNETVDSVSCGTANLFQVQNFTVEAWIKPNSTVRSGSDVEHYHHQYGTIVSYRDINNGLYGWWLGFDYHMGDLLLVFTISGNIFEFYSSNNVWYNTSWYHVAATYNRTGYGNLNIYKNGSLDAQNNSTYAIQYNLNLNAQSELMIGAQPPRLGSDNQYGGLIDEVRIWNVTRTQGEIQNAMVRVLNTTEMANPNLIGYWRFDEGAANTTSHDFSSYQHDASLSIPPPVWVELPEFSSIMAMIVFTTACTFAVLLSRRKMHCSQD
jgi:hypothetical protein